MTVLFFMEAVSVTDLKMGGLSEIFFLPGVQKKKKNNFIQIKHLKFAQSEGNCLQKLANITMPFYIEHYKNFNRNKHKIKLKNQMSDCIGTVFTILSVCKLTVSEDHASTSLHGMFPSEILSKAKKQKMKIYSLLTQLKLK